MRKLIFAAAAGSAALSAAPASADRKGVKAAPLSHVRSLSVAGIAVGDSKESVEAALRERGYGIKYEGLEYTFSDQVGEALAERRGERFRSHDGPTHDAIVAKNGSETVSVDFRQTRVGPRAYRVEYTNPIYTGPELAELAFRRYGSLPGIRRVRTMTAHYYCLMADNACVNDGSHAFGPNVVVYASTIELRPGSLVGEAHEQALQRAIQEALGAHKPTF